MGPVFMHRDIGLAAFNRLPYRKALHALYECCNSVAMAGALARARPYPHRAALLSRADTVLFGLSEDAVDEIMQSYPSLIAVTEPKAARNAIAKLNRSRLERMLGPEGGYNNWG